VQRRASDHLVHQKPRRRDDYTLRTYHFRMKAGAYRRTRRLVINKLAAGGTDLESSTLSTRTCPLTASTICPTAWRLNFYTAALQ